MRCTLLVGKLRLRILLHGQGERDHRNDPREMVGDEDHIAGDSATWDGLLGWRLGAHFMAKCPHPGHQHPE